MKFKIIVFVLSSLVFPCGMADQDPAATTSKPLGIGGMKSLVRSPDGNTIVLLLSSRVAIRLTAFLNVSIWNSQVELLEVTKNEQMQNMDHPSSVPIEFGRSYLDSIERIKKVGDHALDIFGVRIDSLGRKENAAFRVNIGENATPVAVNKGEHKDGESISPYLFLLLASQNRGADAISAPDSSRSAPRQPPEGPPPAKPGSAP
jgi:hypothetical protein